MTQLLIQKIRKLEQQKEELVQKRYEQITSLIKNTNSFAVDNNTLIGALLFLSNPDNKNHEITTSFKTQGSKSKLSYPRPKSHK